jgi:hypothetical protein
MDDPELAKLAKDYNRAEAKANELRPRLYARIYDYKVTHGERRGWQTELVRLTGLTRERIRQIVAIEEKRRAGDGCVGQQKGR